MVEAWVDWPWVDWCKIVCEFDFYWVLACSCFCWNMFRVGDRSNALALLLLTFMVLEI